MECDKMPYLLWGKTGNEVVLKAIDLHRIARAAGQEDRQRSGAESAGPRRSGEVVKAA
jgi:hypothetical protein